MSAAEPHSHVFLGSGHEHNERKTWWVIGLCSLMMLLEIGGGVAFGSIALVADGLHMSTHAGAMLLAALAYTMSRRYANDPRFTFGTGKLGDLAGFTSAIILAMIALLIGYEAVTRLLSPVPIHFGEAIPIATLGLAVNLVSAWILSGGEHHHHHHHGHSHEHDEEYLFSTPAGPVRLEIFEDGVPPRFRIHGHPASVAIETRRADGVCQSFALVDRGDFLESVEEIPEPHAFTLLVRHDGEEHSFEFEEHDHGHHHVDHNLRAAVIHVMADAAVSVLVIVGLLLARSFGWLWMDPVAGLVGACVISSWSYGLIRDTGAILLDMDPDCKMASRIRQELEREGDVVTDLHLWRLGPGHLGVIVAVSSARPGRPDDYRARLRRFPALSHVTVEVQGLN